MWTELISNQTKIADLKNINIGEMEEKDSKNYTNFMALERIELAKQMVDLLCNAIITILEKYSLVGDKFKEADEKISNTFVKICG